MIRSSDHHKVKITFARKKERKKESKKESKKERKQEMKSRKT